MGFSVSASFAVAVIASLIALGMLYPAVSGGFESVSQASQDAGDRRLAAANTAIDITGACYDAGANEIEVTVQNRGSMALGLNRTIVLVDNVVQQSLVSRDVDGISGTQVWAPGQTANLTYTLTGRDIIESVGPDPKRVAVSTEHGIRDTEAISPC